MEYNELFEERFTLACGKIKELSKKETCIVEPFVVFFTKTADFLAMLLKLYEKMETKAFALASMEEHKRVNQDLYADILQENYGRSDANPSFAAQAYGKEYGPLFSMLYTQLRGMIPLVFEKRREEILIFLELFIQTACLFEGEAKPPVKEIKEILYSFFYDYSDIFFGKRTVAMADTKDKFAEEIIKRSDGSDLRYLYEYGEYITDNELQMAEYIWKLPYEEVYQIAGIYANGFLTSFEKTGKDRSVKNIANMRYHIGTERIVRCAMGILAESGFAFSIFRKGCLCTDGAAGYEGAAANRQYSCDHASDLAVVWDKPMVSRALDSIKNAFEKLGNIPKGYGGPVCLETFGEVVFKPEICKDAIEFTGKQRGVFLEYTTKKLDIVNKYTAGEDRSFTIMAIPLPETGKNYDALFQAVNRINSLDSERYEKIQQLMIDALDQCDTVKIKGKNPNRTDLTVQLQKIENPEKQTIFENCVADVNIPVGEIFTSPVLKGTNGTLFVGEAYLDALFYENLSIVFQDGKVVDYSCTNFEDAEDSRKYILENAFRHHENLPMGEFAIGTNTTAYAAGKKYHISGKLPVLIAEKTGPHFAVGDTCYSHEEEQKVIGINGKEMIAKDNEISVLRKADPLKAYFGCHMDITIPYDELDSITGVKKDGTKIPVISAGRFVLPGTESLNDALDAIE